jgi:hypothetical protein
MIVNELDFNNHTKEELSKKLLCFGVNGVNVFIGGGT